jgi:hypothetical protein
VVLGGEGGEFKTEVQDNYTKKMVMAGGKDIKQEIKNFKNSHFSMGHDRPQLIS